MYITMVEFLEGIPKMLVLCNFLRKLIVSDKTIHGAFRTQFLQLYEENQLGKFFIFTIYQNYTGCPPKSGTADFPVPCELKISSFFTSLDKASSAEKNDTKIIKFG